MQFFFLPHFPLRVKHLALVLVPKVVLVVARRRYLCEHARVFLKILTHVIVDRCCCPPPRHHPQKGGKEGAAAASTPAAAPAPPAPTVTGPVLTLEEIGTAQFGLYPLVQSQQRTDRVWTPVRDLQPSKADQDVLVRARIHTSRSKGLNMLISTFLGGVVFDFFFLFLVMDRQNVLLDASRRCVQCASWYVCW